MILSLQLGFKIFQIQFIVYLCINVDSGWRQKEDACLCIENKYLGAKRRGTLSCLQISLNFLHVVNMDNGEK